MKNELALKLRLMAAVVTVVLSMVFWIISRADVEVLDLPTAWIALAAIQVWGVSFWTALVLSIRFRQRKPSPVAIPLAPSLDLSDGRLPSAFSRPR